MRKWPKSAYAHASIRFRADFCRVSVCAPVVDRPLAVETSQLVARQPGALRVSHRRGVGAVRAEDVTAASHSVTLEVRMALQRADAVRRRANVWARILRQVRATCCGKVASVARVPRPDLLSIVHAACATSLVRLQLGCCAKTGAHRSANRDGVDPAVRSLVVASVVGAATEARVGTLVV